MRIEVRHWAPDKTQSSISIHGLKLSQLKSLLLYLKHPMVKALDLVGENRNIDNHCEVTHLLLSLKNILEKEGINLNEQTEKSKEP